MGFKGDWMAWYVSRRDDKAVNTAFRKLHETFPYERHPEGWLRFYGEERGIRNYWIFGKEVKYRFGWSAGSGNPDGGRWEKWWINGEEIDSSEIKGWLREQAIEAGIVMEAE